MSLLQHSLVNNKTIYRPLFHNLTRMNILLTQSLLVYVGSKTIVDLFFPKTFILFQLLRILDLFGQFSFYSFTEEQYDNPSLLVVDFFFYIKIYFNNFEAILQVKILFVLITVLYGILANLIGF